MPITETLRRFSDGTRLVFETGKFDDWCVSFYRGNRRMRIPTDVEMFTQLEQLGDNKDTMAVVLSIADQINGANTNFADLKIWTVHEDSLAEQKLFSALAAAMIAEERKDGTKIGKGVKLVGIHQTLVWGMEPWLAANWSKGKSWQEIKRICDEYDLLLEPKQSSFFALAEES